MYRPGGGGGGRTPPPKKKKKKIWVAREIWAKPVLKDVFKLFWLKTKYFLFLPEVGIVKPVKFTRDSGCLARDELLVISKEIILEWEILEAEQKMYASSRRVRGLGYMTVSEMLETMHENDLFDIFPEFSKVLHMISLQ